MPDVSGAYIDRLLLDAGLIDEQSLSLARGEAVGRQRMLAEIVIDLGFVDQLTLADLIARKGGIPIASPIDLEAAKELAKQVPTHLARKHMIVPIDRDGDTLVVAMIDPNEPGTIEILESTTGMKIRPAVGVRSEVETAVIELYGVDEETEITLLSRGLSLDHSTEDSTSDAEVSPHDLFEDEPDNEDAEAEKDDANRTIFVRPAESELDESTAPTVSRQSTESNRSAHVERQLVGIMRALALIQTRLDAIDQKIAHLVDSTRVTR